MPFTADKAASSKILFISHVDSYFVGFIELVRLLNSSPEFTPGILFPADYPNLTRHIDICRSERIPFTTLTQPCSVTSLPLLRRAKRSLTARGSRLVSDLPLVGYLSHLLTFKRKIRKIRNTLATAAPNLIVLGGDIVGHDMALYIRAGHELGIPSILLPNWMAGPRESAEQNVEDRRFYLNHPMNRLFGYFFPHWVYTHKGRALVRQPAQEALALETLRLAPPVPWTLHSGFADRIAVESEAALQYGLNEGLSITSLVVTGSCTHDKIHDQIAVASKARARLCEQHGLSQEKPLFLSALPPDQLYGRGRRECDFQDYRELARFWISSLCEATGGNVVFSLHPSAGEAQHRFAAELGAKISGQPVSELIPLCDCYVACISATIQWAIACGKPVINYDVYRYRYTDYMGLKGVLTIEEQDQFLDGLRRMATDDDFRNEIAVFQQAEAARWGNLDGKAGERITALFRRLIETTER